MKNGQVKHSTLITEADLPVESAELIERYTRFTGSPPRKATLEDVKEPGFYILFQPSRKAAGSLKGPFDSPEQAKSAHGEWMFESKH